ncbi:hypothetical protein RF11_16408 [Thelohanellus kitauei]|uniref:Uncharacterized protein n=1 Tax=Thelohanellus kitauei TaxID=669202 RepID=A0A0C2J3G9_THEKT|nr:hypothetical protein RF11_16408 [Thelohanellus kitauei]
MPYEGMVNFKTRERKYITECLHEYLLEIFEIFQALEISERKSFSKWKGLVRKANSRSTDELFSSIEASSTNITSNDCLGFYRHIERYLPDCIQGCHVKN